MELRSESPDGGGFVNFEGGSFDNLRYTSTSGMGIGMLKWNIDRPFVFFENGIFYKRYLSIYHSLQADSPSGNAAVAAPGPGISRSFLTVRLQPMPRVEFDLNHTYFRDIPTFDPQLIGTGCWTNTCSRAFSGGARVQVLSDVWTYFTLGRSSRSGDAQASWNQLYGVTVGRMPGLAFGRMCTIRNSTARSEAVLTSRSRSRAVSMRPYAGKYSGDGNRSLRQPAPMRRIS